MGKIEKAKVDDEMIRDVAVGRGARDVEVREGAMSFVVSARGKAEQILGKLQDLLGERAGEHQVVPIQDGLFGVDLELR